MRGSRSIELARLKKEEETEERKKNIWPILRVPGLVPSRYFLAPLWVVLVIKTLEGEWYIVMSHPVISSPVISDTPSTSLKVTFN